jgi:hypothetical protein
VKDLKVKTNAADLRDKTVRFGRIMLVTHVTILDGWKETKAGHIQELVTHKDPTQWAIEKCEVGRDGKECCYTIANVIFKDPTNQEEYDLRSVGSRLIDCIDAEDLENLKLIVDVLDKHCEFRHEEKYYGSDQ